MYVIPKYLRYFSITYYRWKQIFQYNVIMRKRIFLQNEMSDFSCLLMHYAMMKYLIFHVFSCITQCWNILFLMYSHALRNAEQSNVSNILLLYAMLRYLIFHVLLLSLHILFRFDSQFTDFVSFRRISFRLVVFRFVSLCFVSHFTGTLT
jgi:hypothetical protein